MTVLGVAAGTLGTLAGLGMLWTLIAIVIGNAVGTVLMAAHSAQGPQLGIPQMIQSRAQFGVRGAGLPLAAAVITYLLYCASNSVVIRGPAHELLSVSNEYAMVWFAAATLIIAFVGYELIHRFGVVLTILSTALFLAAACLLLTRPIGHGALELRSATQFSRAAFALTMTQAGAWTLSYGPYVADYSRYLPPDVPARQTFWYTALGCWSSSTLIMALGAYLAWIEPGLANDPANAIAGLFGAIRPLVQVLILLGLVQGNVMNLYSAYMSVVTVVSGVHGASVIGRGQKLLIMSALMICATAIAQQAQDHFSEYFADTLSLMLYLLVPWSAINLVDYYWIRHGKYDISAMYQVDGPYGAYRPKTLLIYGLGVLVQEPFMSLSFHQGTVARWIGADIAWLPGLVVSATLYYLAERKTSHLTPKVPYADTTTE